MRKEKREDLSETKRRADMKSIWEKKNIQWSSFSNEGNEIIVKSDVQTCIALPFWINAIFAKISGGRRPLCMMKFVCEMTVWCTDK